MEEIESNNNIIVVSPHGRMDGGYDQ